MIKKSKSEKYVMHYSLGDNTLIWAFRFYAGEPISYKELLESIAKKLEIKTSERPLYEATVEGLEILISQKIIRMSLEKMTPSERAKLDDEWKQKANQLSKESRDGKLIFPVTYAALAGTAQLSGFGVYQLSTTALGIASHAFGVTLPFSVYTTLTKSIFFAIGPIGWFVAGFSLLGLSGPNYGKIIPAILYIASVNSLHSGNQEVKLFEDKRPYTYKLIGGVVVLLIFWEWIMH